MSYIIKNKKVKDIVRTGIIILFIYLLFIAYLLCVSKRVEKLENNSSDIKNYSLKVDY